LLARLFQHDRTKRGDVGIGKAKRLDAVLGPFPKRLPGVGIETLIKVHVSVNVTNGSKLGAWMQAESDSGKRNFQRRRFQK